MNLFIVVIDTAVAIAFLCLFFIKVGPSCVFAKKCSPFENLPPEILDAIGEMCSEDDIFSLYQVNRKFRAVFSYRMEINLNSFLHGKFPASFRNCNFSSLGTVLMFAAKTGSLDIVKKLARFKMKPYDLDIALHYACLGCNSEIVSTLLCMPQCHNLGGRDFYDNTTLHQACKSGTIEIAKILIGKGADLESVNREGFRPLHLAVKQNRYDLVAYLLALKADPCSRDAFGKTALHYATATVVADLLLAYGSDINARCILGLTPIHNAIHNHHEDIVLCMLKHGADFTVKDILGNTVVHHAVVLNTPRILNAFCSKSASL